MMILPFLLAIGVCVVAWKKPTTAILLFPILLPTYVLRTNLGPLPTTGLELALLGLLLGVTIAQGKPIWREGLRRSKPWHTVMLAWMAVTMLSVIVAPHHMSALGLWRAYVLEPMIYSLLVWSALREEKDRRMFLHALMIVVTGIAMWCIWQFATNSGIPTPWNTIDLASRRATGPFPFPNAVALFCVPLTALFMGLLLSPSAPLKRYWLLLESVTGVIATGLAKSDGGLVAILAALGIALLWNPRTRWKAVVLGLIGFIAIISTPTLRTKATETLFFKEWSGQVRLYIWRESWTMLKDRPIFGAGLGGYPETFAPYHKATAIEIFQYPHTILFNFWSETGLLGIFVFGWICYAWIRAGRSRRDLLPYLLPLIAILVHGLVDVPYFKNDIAMEFWMLIALLSASQALPPSKTLASFERRC